MASQNSPKPTKAQRTAAAREKARELREAQQRKEKRNSLLLRWGIVAAVVAIIVVIAVIVSNNIRSTIPDAGPVPTYGNSHGGIELTSATALAAGTGGTVDHTTLAARPSEAPAEVLPPSGVVPGTAGEPTPIVVYLDFSCSHCRDFEASNAEQLKTWLDAGDATVEYRAVGYLDNPATGNYSSRAANAAACVADAAPEKYLDYVVDLFERQTSGGYSNKELIGFAGELGVQGIDDCVEGNTYRPYVKYTDELARVDGVGGTPDVWVDGESWAVANQEFIPWAQAKIDAKKAA